MAYLDQDGARIVLTQGDARAINALPRAAHLAIPDTGHVRNVGQPDLFRQHMLAFLHQSDLRAPGTEARSR